ncbi:bifunctional metallophosphatase/5'-nucleotidase (plasmid) [Streptomyces sp. NBC_00536]|uniref:bifunctional metallophosphatase/5'-nucleotidase n=1 Tax=Streptomyces sp. NBC_00536 TaxID=2975769 RepID=UPI002E80BF50|nr:bifunctional metallophosphatase/5'-nucleotidase [Streptomyces sp. NBC_00536]WUC84145.1 bifunctional metallophosphatase/5'-nucleotidase [Streptomyces sp. NBC_00536]
MGRRMGRRRFLTAAGTVGVKALTGTAVAGSAAGLDRVSAAGYVDVQLLNITDLHGYLSAPPARDAVIAGADGATYTVGGVAYMATHLQRLRAGWANSFFFAPGDLFSGWEFPAFSLSDEPTIEALNRLGLNFATAGNHEFDRTPGFLVEHMQRGAGAGVEGAGITHSFPDSAGRPFHGADFRYYSANVTATGQDGTGGTGGTEAPVLPPYHVEWVSAPGGRRLPIGFIHLTALGTEGFPNSFQPGLRTADEVATADRCAALLKAQGVNAIVLSMHDGAVAGDAFDSGTAPSGPAYELALRVSADIDAIVTGHWHRAFTMMLPDPAGRPRPFVEAGCHGQIVNEITLRLDPDTGAVVRELTTSTNHPNTRDVPADPGLREVVDHWEGYARQRAGLTIGRQRAPFQRRLSAAGESTMGNLVADWALWAAGQAPDPFDTSPRPVPAPAPADLALIALAPRLGRSVINTDLVAAPGEDIVTFERAWRAVGYGNPLVTASVSGAQLHDALEQQWAPDARGALTYAPLAVSANVRYSFDPDRPAGDRVAPADVLIGGAALRPEAVYRVVTTSYTLTGQDGYPALGGFREPVRHRRDMESFTAYVASLGTLEAAPTGRVTAKGGASVLPGRAGRLMPLDAPVTELPTPVAAAEEAARDTGRRPVC